MGTLMKCAALGAIALLAACGESTKERSLVASANLSTRQYILFAHGFKDDEHAWDTYVRALPKCEDGQSLEGVCYVPLRTSVSEYGSIEIRAGELADYINEQNLTEESLIAVGHSMGGLDLHYIVSKGNEDQTQTNRFYRAAKTISRIYTLASPHKGNQFAGILPDGSGALHDMGIAQMREFNKKYPYSTYEIDGRNIPLFALRFLFLPDSDGIVALKNQSLNGAPHLKDPIPGRHAKSVPDDGGGVLQEVENTDVLHGILKGKKGDTFFTYQNRQLPFDTFDIVFYEGNDCSQDEKGVFSSRQYGEADSADVGCKFREDGSYEGGCADDEIRSMEIFPGIGKQSAIRVLNDPDGRLSDDWARLHIGNTELRKSLCISSFEHQTTSAEKEKDITVQYFRNDSGIGDGLDGKISRLHLGHSTLKYDPHDLVFYDGGSCSGNAVAFFISSESYNINCQEGDLCPNDSIRSLYIYPSIVENTLIRLYDDPDGDKVDDYVRIHVGRYNSDTGYCIDGFEHQTNSSEKERDITVVYHSKNDDLNGNVSHVKIDKATNPNDPDDIVFYEDGDCRGNFVGIFQSTVEAHASCSDSHACVNDEARSVLIYPGAADHVAIRVYDDPDGSKDRDYATIYRGSKKFDSPYCISDFERDLMSADTGIEMNYHDVSALWGLTGKVSYIKITDSGKIDE